MRLQLEQSPTQNINANPTEMWRRVWRDGLGPQLSDSYLEELRLGLIRDDDRLLQGYTAQPEPFAVFAREKIEGCCALGFGAWQTGMFERVGDLGRFFERLCCGADEAVGEMAAARLFLDWYDQTPRPLMRHELLAEVNRLLNQRHPAAA